MKKLYVLIIALGTYGAYSQSSNLLIKDLENGNATVSNNQVFNQSTTASGVDFHHILEVKNTSASSQTISVRKYEDQVNTVSGNDKAQAYFCFNTYCYTPEVMTATTALAAGASFTFYPKLDEASQVGESDIRYKITTTADVAGENMILVMKYNAPVLVKENSTYFASVSAIYPTPSASKAYMDLTVAQETNGLTLKVINSVGSVVLNKQISLNKGKNTIGIDSENFDSGIYFVTLSNGSSKISKKLIITK